METIEEILTVIYIVFVVAIIIALFIYATTKVTNISITIPAINTPAVSIPLTNPTAPATNAVPATNMVPANTVPRDTFAPISGSSATMVL